jgi:hypothetical protein
METYAHFIPNENSAATIENFSASILGNVSTDVSITSANVK